MQSLPSFNKFFLISDIEHGEKVSMFVDCGCRLEYILKRLLASLEEQMFTVLIFFKGIFNKLKVNG